MNNILLKNAMLVTPEEIIPNISILIKDGIIEKISESGIKKYDGFDEFDAFGNFVSAGFIDLHAHLRDPGYEYKEDIISGTKSAVKGGFTTVLCMPNTKPCIDSIDTVAYICNKAKNSGYCNILPIGAITQCQQGEHLTDFAELKKSGVIAISDDGRPVENSGLMHKALTKAKENDMIVISHCEDLSLLSTGGSINSIEDTITARDIILAGETEARLHIAHVSSGNSVDFVEWGKRKGYKITAETCPHYFSLTDTDAIKIGVNAKMNPPLRTKGDKERVIEGIKSGIIDCISTDHAPHSPEEKCEESNNFAKALNGIIGFETAFSVGVTYLVKTGIITLNKLIELMTVNPAKIIGIDSNSGRIKEGAAADIVVFNISERYIYNRANIYSKARNTPYDGFELYGKVLCTAVGGHIKYQNQNQI